MDAAVRPPEAPTAWLPPPAPPASPPEPTPTPTAFAPTHRVAAAHAVNLSTRPSSANGAGNEAVRALPPGEPLASLGDEEAGWMRFRTGAGEEGWVRRIDVAAAQP